MTSSLTHRLTLEDVDGHMPANVRWELVDGELRIMSPAGDYHGRVTAAATIIIGGHVRRHGLGRVYAAETGFALRQDPDSFRAPDVAFVRSERVRPPGPGYFRGAPDLAVEVVSPSDSRDDVVAKAMYWLEYGTREVWVAWLATRAVTIYGRRPAPVQLDEADTLDGGEVLPGLAVRVGELFE